MICNKVGVARVSDIEEVPTTCEIHDGGFLKLASAFHCINNLNNVPEDVAFTVYRILVIIAISFIIMKMVVP